MGVHRTTMSSRTGYEQTIDETLAAYLDQEFVPREVEDRVRRLRENGETCRALEVLSEQRRS